MGKLRRLKKLRRAIRGTYDPRREELRARVVEAGGRGAILEPPPGFYVGMSVKGPPEAFGLPATPASGLCSAHREDGAYHCEVCYPPRAPVTVTAVDYENGVITLDSASAR